MPMLLGMPTTGMARKERTTRLSPFVITRGRDHVGLLDATLLIRAIEAAGSGAWFRRAVALAVKVLEILI